MELQDQIPETLYINKTEMSIFVHYSKQPTSCNKCGHSGHKSRWCDRKPNDYKNVIDIEECNGSEVNSEDENEELDDDDDDIDIDVDADLNLSINSNKTNANILDIHFDPSQNMNSYKCTKCDYQCTYENIYIEHMQTHMGENASMSDVYEMVTQDEPFFWKFDLRGMFMKVEWDMSP